MSLLIPNTELVAVSWIKGIPGIPVSSVSTTLPSDNTTWSASGFIQVPFVVGGSPDIDIQMYRPVVQVEFWAVNLSGAKPPWGKAAQLAQKVVQATWQGENTSNPMNRTLTMHVPGYMQARAHSVYFVSEPRRIAEDEARFARYSGDLQIHWRVIE